MSLLRLEFYKLRRKRLAWMIVLFLGIEIAWALAAVSMSIQRNPDQAGWEPLILTFASMNGLFLPVLTAVIVSRLCDMEHKGETWKQLLSVSVSKSAVYAAKFGCSAILLLGACIVQALAITVFGIGRGFEWASGILWISWLLAGTMLANLAVIALQQWVSLSVKNQAFALGLGMVGGFLGMTADLFPSAVRKLSLWSNYSALSPVAQSFSGGKVGFIAHDPVAQLPDAALVIAVGMIIYWAGSRHVSRQDI